MTYSKSNRQIARNTAFLYTRMLVMFFVGLYTSRIVLRELGVVDYGLQYVVNSLLGLFTFIQGSLSTSASRFLSFAIGRGDRQILNLTFSMIQNIHFIFAAVVFLFAETAGLWYFFEKMVIPEERFSACLVVYQLAIISSIYAILVVPYNALIVAEERMGAFAFLSIFSVVSKLLIALSLCLTPVDKLITVAVLTFLLSLVTRSLYIAYCRRHFEESRYIKVWDLQLFREMFVFSGWSMCSYTRLVIEQASNLLINLFFGPTINAARAIANTVQQNLYGFVLNFQVALNPQIVKSFAQEDKHRVYVLTSMSQKISFSLLALILLPLLVNLRFVLDLWLVDVPDYTEPLLTIIAIHSIFTAISNPFGVIAEAANQLRKWNMIIMPYYLLLLPVAYLLLKMGGTVLQLFLLILAFELVGFLIKLRIVHQISGLSIRKEMRLYADVLVSVVCAFLFGYALTQLALPEVLGFFCKGLLSLLYSCVWILFFFLNQTERSHVIKQMKSKFIRR